MGLYDRDYYRQSTRSYRDWLPGRVTSTLIGLLVAIFVIQLIAKAANNGHDPILEYGKFSQPSILNGEVWRFLTAAFVHDTRFLLPIVFGLLMLYFFGRSVEDDIGGLELLCFYATTIVVTQTAEFLARFTGLEKAGGDSFGMIGPITAVLVLFACRHPRATIQLFFVIPVPAWAIAAGWVALVMLGFLNNGDRAEPALPLAGAAFAWIYHTLNLRLSQNLPTKSPVENRRRRPQLRVLPAPSDPPQWDEPVDNASVQPAPSDELLDAKVDRVLEKMARQGRESLTLEEQDLLLQASAAYRKRRE